MSVDRSMRKKYKWVIDVPYLGLWYFFKTKPKAIRGGYMVADGVSYVGKGVTLMSREDYENTYGHL